MKFILFVFASFSLAYSNIINTSVERTLDLSSQLVKESIKIVAQDNNPFSEYQIVFTNEDAKNLAFISAKDGSKKDIKVKEKKVDGQAWYTLTLPSASTNQVINVEVVFSKRVAPYPEEIKQNEKQLAKYVGRIHFYSPYLTKSEKTNVKLSGNPISYTQFKPYSESSNKIKYGPYEDVSEFSNQSLILHYENQSPFMTVTRLERVLEVSHWGNIAVKESIFLTQTGARLKGPFSRYEFQKDGRSGQSAVKSFKTILPASATGVYYTDSIGNISTSNLRVLRDSVELELRPRFPLFGGWKTQYVLGYNVPSYEYLYNSGDKYVLQMRLIDHIYDDMLIDEATVKVILPEGSSNILLIPPYPVQRQPDELFFTYLDTMGRPVIIFTKSNLVENHIADFQLKYNFSKVSLLHEPLLAIGFIFIIFLLTIIFLRLDCSINTTHAHKE